MNDYVRRTLNTVGKIMLTKTIPPEVIAVLQATTCEGKVCKLPLGLERKLYVATNAVLEMLGGNWNKNAKGHVFPDDCEQAISLAIMTGKVADYKKEFQIFETPDAVADRVVQLADIGPTNRILEPSAGRGAILRAINRYGAAGQWKNKPSLFICEMYQPNVDFLNKNFEFYFLARDFMVLAKGGLGAYEFDRIVMNPPFRNGQDIAHVQHAYSLLGKNGRMVALTYPGWEYRQDKKYVDFRNWFASVGGVKHDVPAGAFSKSGTEIRTLMLVINK